MPSRFAVPRLALLLWSLLIPASLVHERCSPVGASQAFESEATGKIDTISGTSLGSSASGILLHHGADQASQARLVANYGKLPLSFVVNEGQADAPVKFVSHGPGYSLFLTGTEAVIALKKSSPQSPAAREPRGLPDPHAAKSAQQTGSEAVRMQLAGANPSPRVLGMDELPGKANYFIGNDPTKWRTNVATYAKVKYEGVYPDVDLVYYGNQGQLEYDFVVAPGADPGLVRLNLHGAGNLRVDEHGDLLLGGEQEQMRFLKPLVYQEIAGRQTPVDSSYALASNGEVTFQIGGYDHAHPLVIDPVLVYQRFLGTGDINFTQQGNGIAVDASGNAYITGSTTSPNFPTLNALQPTMGDSGFGDAFVSKLSPSGSLIYSTYLGGNQEDIGRSIAVDASGNAYVTGLTYSTNFPTANALQSALGHPSTSNAFVTKVGPTGSTLVYSTYLGGSGSGAGGDIGYGIAADSSGNAYVTGFTNSLNFPLVNALQAKYSGTFVSKINPSGSAFVYSTYLGGGYFDQARAIAVDTSGSAYVTGITGSGNFPTVNAFQPQFGGQNSDAFVAKLNSAGSALIYSTYLGGSGNDEGDGIAVDASGNAYVTGYTYSANFPTANALQPNLANAPCCRDAFVSKLNSTGSGLIYSTYLGGGGDDGGTSIAVDVSGNAYVTGFTDSPNFPTANPLQTTLSNAFVSAFNSTGSKLLYSTYLGVNGDSAYGIGVDALGNAYLTGVNVSSGAVATVNKISPGILTTTTLTSSLNPANLGQAVTFTATVTTQGAGTPTGTITFSDSNLVLAQVPLGANGQATFTTSSFMPLGHSISAQYNGDANFASSIATLTQTIIGPILNGVPAALNFGQQLFETTSAPQLITLSNTGNADLHISVSILGLNPGSNPADFAQTNTCTSVAPATSCQINVTFTPVTGGPRSATLSLNDDAAGSPQLVALSGFGLGPVVGFPSGSSVGFGNQQIGTTSSADTVTLKNVGTAPLFISGVTITGLNVGDFSKANFCPIAPVSLAPGATCSINVTFTPTAEGTRYASLTFTDGPPIIPVSSQSVGLVGTGTGQAAVPAPDVAFLGGGSSSLFVQLGQAAIDLNGGAGGACVWTQGPTSSIVARDNRTSPATDEQGNIWIVWSPGTGSCAAPAGNFAVQSYMSVDTAANRCFFEVDSSGTPGCVQIITVAPNTPGANLLCYPSSSTCSFFGDTAGGIPATVINAIANQHWFAAGTDILPADAKFAIYRMLTACGQPIWRQPFDQILRQTSGLGYPTSTPAVGTPVQSFYSSASAGVLDFNIMGNDPLTGLSVPAYSSSTIGAQPIVVAVSPAGGNGIGAATDIPSFVLMNFYNGTLGRATDLLGPSTPSAITTLVREPQSGDYNVFEWSAVNNSQFHDSQDAFNCNSTTGAIVSNPMNLPSMNGNAASPGGQNSFRRRVIGTAEMTAQLQVGTGNDNRLGYFYWSAANVAGFNAGNGKYLAVDGVDPLQDAYTDGVFPGVDGAHPLSNVTFKSLNAGDYPIWSALRLVSQSPTPVGVSNLITAAQQLNSLQFDFIPISNLTVWHSHYYLPALGSNTAANGSTLNPATPNDLCPGNLPEFGGDAGGVNILKQANADFCADFGNISGLVDKTN